MYRANRPVGVLLNKAEASRQTYVTGLVAASNKTVQGISNHVLPAKSERALNKFLTEYDWDEDQLNRERLKLLQQADDNRWSSEGVVIE